MTGQVMFMSMHRPHAVAGDGCVSVMDIGTNTVMTLAVLGGPHGVDDVEEIFRTTRLGAGVGATGMLSGDAQARTLAAVRDQRAHLLAHYPHGVGVTVATSAVRDAANAEDFLCSCTALLGSSPVVLSGTDEARLAFRGAVSDLPSGASVMAVDIGGGSTEISWGRVGEECVFAVSVDVGCVRLAERFDLLGCPHEEDVERSRTFIREALSAPLDRLERGAMGAPLRVVASGGSVTTFAAMDQKLACYDRARIHGYTGHSHVLRESVPRLFGLTCGQRQGLPGVPADRAAVLPSGLLILDELLSMLEVQAFGVSTRGLRYGLALAIIAGDWAPAWSW